MRDTEIEDKYDELAERWKEIADRRDRYEALLELAEDAMRAANNVSYEHDAVSHYCDRIWQASHDARSRAAFELKKAEADMEAYDRDLKELEGPLEAAYERKMNA